MFRELGKEKYMTLVKEYAPISSKPKTFGEIPLKLGNEQDVLGENIENYLPYDIIYLYGKTHIFRFTRIEFNGLLKTKKNPWTNENLSDWFLSELKHREDMTTRYGLPNCDTFNNLYDKLEKGEEFKTTMYNDDDNISNRFMQMLSQTVFFI